MSSRVHVSDPPAPTDAGKVLVCWREIFPVPGVYEVEFLGKASKPEGDGPFEEWFMAMLEDVTKERFVNSQLAIWEVLERILAEKRVAAPSELDWWELNRTLFDLTTASTARMVGLDVPRELAQRLMAIGFKVPAILDFPAIAYRMGLIYRRLQDTKPLPWEELRRLAESRPLTEAEMAGVQYARRRAGQWLRPVYDETGRIWTAHREFSPLRRLTAGQLEDRTGPRKAARELWHQQRAQGVFRDAERVARTELAEARSMGSWAAETKGATGKDLFYRQVSATPCVSCLTLFTNPDGSPRLYTMADLEEGQKTVNTGPRDQWHARVGPVHPNCVCSPPLRYVPAMRLIFEQTAPKWRELREAMGMDEAA